jgi:hypothetical protein
MLNNPHTANMKCCKLHILIAILIFPSFNGFAQLQLGVRGGYNVSGIVFSPSKNAEPILNPIADFGLIAKHYNLEYVGFQGELSYTQRGFIVPTLENKLKKRVNTYIEMPLFFQVRTSGENMFGHVNIGFYASALLKSKVGLGQGNSFTYTEYELSILRDNFFDYGLLGGVGLGYNIGWATVQLDIRYSYGLGDLYYYNYSGNPYRSPAWVLNSSISLMVNLEKLKKPKKVFEEEIIKDKLEDFNQQ